MKVVGVIPARFASTRLPGKPLVKLLGKPMLAWVVEAARAAKHIQEVIVATDHEEIAQIAKLNGAKAVMTDPNLATGTDRVWAAVKDSAADVVLNIQGDEPLLEGRMLDELIEPFFEDKELSMATLGRPLKAGDLESPNTAKIILNQKHEAVYFSRLPIPYSRVSAAQIPGACLKHVGIYAFRRAFLGRFCAEPPCSAEKAESLEQLRALHLGARIRVVLTEGDSWGVDTPEDVSKIEKLLTERKT